MIRVDLRRSRVTGPAVLALLASAGTLKALGSPGFNDRRPQDLPDGQGRATVQRLCDSSCHGIERFADERRTRARWFETIGEMQDRGAILSDDEVKTVAGYLGAHLGVPLKINEATAKQIDESLDLSPGQADAIVKYREAHGKFADWAALLKVPGLDAKKLDDQKTVVVF
jgi:competence ComEA-like helix-hairpin-helix protein